MVTTSPVLEDDHAGRRAGKTTAFSRSLFCRIGDACVPGTLLAWLLGPVEVVGRVDERDVGERLGEIANKALRLRIVFLREQAHVVAQSHKSLE